MFISISTNINTYFEQKNVVLRKFFNFNAFLTILFKFLFLQVRHLSIYISFY